MFRFMHKRTQRKAAQEILLARAEKERNLWSTISTLTPDEALELMDSSKSGLSEFLVEASSEYYGPNVITQVKRESPLKRFALSFVSPFTGILFLLALVSFITDYSMMPHGQRDLSTVLIILVMILLSGLMTFIQEFRGDQAAQKLSELVENTIAVTRKGAPQTEIPMDEVVVGDIVHLAAGDMVPADLRILEANDLFINQSAMTGESEPVEKSAAPVAPGEHTAQMEIPNLAFMGTNVQSGSPLGIVYSTGDETVLGQMDDETLSDAALRTQVFAKLNPLQKARVVTLLRARGHVVGYMGDGINDAAAMRASDVGVSVDNAVDIAKESAQVILLKKDLMVLERGLIEGRKVYANLIKYIKITASSNFGNMLSVLVASAILPFLPMAAIHLLLLNLVYDITCLTLPFDNVDRDYLLKPRQWQAHTITSFMLRIGPVSSIFDILTYALMFFLIAPQVVGAQWSQLTAAPDKALFIALFQAGWFVVSMWTQTLVVHMIRTEKIPIVQSRASLPVWVVGLLGCLVITLIPYIPLGATIGLAPLPFVYFLYLAAILVLYMVFVTGAKWLYIKRHGELL